MREKATMVRVFVNGNVPDGTIIRDVVADLRTSDGVTEQIVADLHFMGGRGFVVRADDRNAFEIFSPAVLQEILTRFRDAFDFEFRDGHGPGTFGMIPARNPLSVSVELRQGDRLLGAATESFTLRRFTDADGDERHRLSFHFIETPDHQLITPPRIGGRKNLRASRLPQEQFDALLAVYPVPHTQGELLVDYRVLPMGGTDPLSYLQLVALFHLASQASTIDRFVFITPGETDSQRSVVDELTNDDVNGFAPVAFPSVIFIDERPSTFTTAHEDGHQLGLSYRGRHPAHNNRPAADGWEVRRSLPGPPRRAVADQFISFMSAQAELRRWAARGDYEQLLQKMTAAGGGAAAAAGGGASAGGEPVVFVAGRRRNDGSIELAPFFTSVGVADDLLQGGHSARAVAADGRVLATRSFRLRERSDDTFGDVFGFFLPFPPGVARIEIARGPEVLAARLVSSNAPVVQAFALESVGDDMWRVSFSAVDPDADELTIAAAYTPDGVRFLPVHIDVANDGMSFEFAAAGVPGSDAGRVRVTVTDGVHAQAALSPPAVFPDEPPVVAILSPPAGTVVSAVAPVTLRGTAYDAEDGVVSGDALHWSSDLDGALGIGEWLTVNRLSPGTHRITLVALDSFGMPDEVSRTITVLSDTAAPDLIVTDLSLESPVAVPGALTTLRLRVDLAGGSAAARVALSDQRPGPPDQPLLEDVILLRGNEEVDIPLTARLRGGPWTLIARVELLGVTEANTANNEASIEIGAERSGRGSRRALRVGRLRLGSR